MAFALSRSYVAACGLWGMGAWEWRVEGVAGLFGFSNGRRGTAEGKFAPGYLFPLCIVRWHGMAVCLCVRICVGAYMLTRTRARKNPRFFLPTLGLVETRFLAFEKFTKKKKQKERT